MRYEYVVYRIHVYDLFIVSMLGIMRLMLLWDLNGFHLTGLCYKIVTDRLPFYIFRGDAHNKDIHYKDNILSPVMQHELF